MTLSDVTASSRSRRPESSRSADATERPSPPVGVGRAGHPESHRAVALVLALTAGLSLILALFVSIAVNSGPNGIRLAVAGPPPAVEQIKAGVATRPVARTPSRSRWSATRPRPGRRCSDRTVDGAIVIGPNGPTVLTASAGSPAITQTADGRGCSARWPGRRRPGGGRRRPAPVR